MNPRNQQQQIGWVQSVAVSRVWNSLLSAFEQIIDLWRRSRAASGPSVKLFQVFSRAELASNFTSSSSFFLPVLVPIQAAICFAFGIANRRRSEGCTRGLSAVLRYSKLDV